MKYIFIVQSGFQDGPEVFTTCKKAYAFVVKQCSSYVKIPTYGTVLKAIREEAKMGNAIWGDDGTWDGNENFVSILKREINPIFY